MSEFRIVSILKKDRGTVIGRNIKGNSRMLAKAYSLPISDYIEISVKIMELYDRVVYSVTY